MGENIGTLLVVLTVIFWMLVFAMEESIWFIVVSGLVAAYGLHLRQREEARERVRKHTERMDENAIKHTKGE